MYRIRLDGSGLIHSSPPDGNHSSTRPASVSLRQDAAKSQRGRVRAVRESSAPTPCLGSQSDQVSGNGLYILGGCSSQWGVRPGKGRGTHTVHLVYPSASRRRFLKSVATLGASAAGLVLLNGGSRLASAAQTEKVPVVGYIGDPPGEPWVK